MCSKLCTSIRNNGDLNSIESYHFFKVQLSIILYQIGSLYRQEMGWFCCFINNNPNRIMLPSRPWQPMMKYILIISHFLPPFPLCYTLIIWALGNKLSSIFCHAFPLIYLSQVAVRLGGTRMNGISGAMSILQDPLLECIHLRYT